MSETQRKGATVMVPRTIGVAEHNPKLCCCTEYSKMMDVYKCRLFDRWLVFHEYEDGCDDIERCQECLEAEVTE